MNFLRGDNTTSTGVPNETKVTNPLLDAVSRGDHALTGKLLLKGIGLKSEDNQLRCDALHMAAEKGHLQIMQLLLRNHADINCTNGETKETLLHVATKHKQLDVLDFLLNEGLDIDRKRKDGCTAFLLSVKYGNVDLAQLLLAHGADPSVKANNGGNALMFAAACGHVPMVELLLRIKADLNAVDNMEFTALMKAVESDHLSVAQILLNQQANRNAQNELGMTALILAVLNKSIEMALLLLKHGATIDLAETGGMTPLMVAAELGYTEIVQLLLANGASVHTLCKAGHWALRYAARSGHVNTVKALIHANRSLLSVREAATSVLSAAAEGGHVEVVKYLLSLEADINYIGEYSPLQVAVTEGCTEVVELLIDRGADMSVLDKNSRSLLMLAAMNNSVEIVQLLLDEGVDVNFVEQNDGYTALHFAAQAGHKDAANVLLSQGRAAVNIKDKIGKTAYDIASAIEIRELFPVSGALAQLLSAVQPAVESLSHSRHGSRSNSFASDASEEASPLARASTSVFSQLTHHTGEIIEDVLILVPCGDEPNRTEPGGSVYIYSHNHERLSADAAGYLSWRGEVDASCVWTVQLSLVTPRKYTLRSKHGLFLSHYLLWGFCANRNQSSTKEEFDVTLLPSMYPSFCTRAAFRLKSWMGGTLCKGVGPKAVVSRLILDETFGNRKAVGTEETDVHHLDTVSRQCARLLRHAEGIAERKKWIEDRTEWRARLKAALYGNQFAQATELSERLHQHSMCSSQLFLCERHFSSFNSRRVELLEQLSILCRALTVQKEYDHLKVAAELRVKLLQLHVDPVNTSGIPQATIKLPGSTAIDDLLNRVNTWLVDDGNADESAKWIETKNSLTAQLAQAELGSDFGAVSFLGKKLLAHQAAAAQLIVSEEKYHTIRHRRAQLFTELKKMCIVHTRANQYDVVRQLSTALDAMNVTADRYKAEDCAAPEAPAELVTLSLNTTSATKDEKYVTIAEKTSPDMDHTSPTSVAALPPGISPCVDLIPCDLCDVPSPRPGVVLTDSDFDPVWVDTEIEGCMNYPVLR